MLHPAAEIWVWLPRLRLLSFILHASSLHSQRVVLRCLIAIFRQHRYWDFHVLQCVLGLVQRHFGDLYLARIRKIPFGPGKILDHIHELLVQRFLL